VTADRPAGSYASTFQVALACSDEFSGCREIRYTDDNSEPTVSSNLYAGPLTVSATRTLKFMAFDHAGNQGAVQSLAYAIESGTAPLTVLFTGSGSGTVDYSTGGSCVLAGGCGESFTNGTVVDLTPVPLAGSFFGGWSGCDSLNVTVCRVVMSSLHGVTATFSPLAARIAATPYTTLAAALGAAGEGATLRLQTSMMPENITYSLGKVLTLSGGFDPTFSSQSDLSRLLGLTIVAGTLILDGITIM